MQITPLKLFQPNRDSVRKVIEAYLIESYHTLEPRER